MCARLIYIDSDMADYIHAVTFYDAQMQLHILENSEFPVENKKGTPKILA